MVGRDTGTTLSLLQFASLFLCSKLKFDKYIEIKFGTK